MPIDSSAGVVVVLPFLFKRSNGFLPCSFHQPCIKLLLVHPIHPTDLEVGDLIGGKETSHLDLGELQVFGSLLWG
jgi:hypothetical protein